MMSFKTRFAILEHRTNISSDILRIYLSKRLGTSLIISRNLLSSEILLSMTFKALRKMLNNPSRYELKSGTSEDKLITTLQKIYQRYAEFYKLHDEYFNTKSNEKAICAFLKFPLIIDLGISRKIFREALFSALAVIAPWELEALYRINTIYRLLIAKELQKISPTPLFIRGSLLFFYARSFGIGYRANLLGLDQQKQIDQYDQVTGSDIDLRWINQRPSKFNVQSEVKKFISKLNISHAKKDISFIVEFATMSNSSSDDIAPVKLIDKLIDLYLETFPFIHNTHSLDCLKLFSYDQIRGEKLKRPPMQNELHLTSQTRKALETAFTTTLKQYGANDVTVRKLSKQWGILLTKSQRETNFSGCINISNIREAFHHLFLFSGHRFSKRDEDELFDSMKRFFTSLDIPSA